MVDWCALRKDELLYENRSRLAVPFSVGDEVFLLDHPISSREKDFPANWHTGIKDLSVFCLLTHRSL